MSRPRKELLEWLDKADDLAAILEDVIEAHLIDASKRDTDLLELMHTHLINLQIAIKRFRV